MKPEELQNLLFDPTQRLFAILDGGNIPNLPNKLYETQLESYCLLEGDLAPDVLYQAPYLVRLLPNHEFTNWLFEGFLGENKGIFAHSRATLIDMRKHFTALVKVHDETGRPLMFRYYDPRVFRKFLPTCNEDELETIFGEVTKFFVERDEDVEEVVRYELTDEGLKQSDVEVA